MRYLLFMLGLTCMLLPCLEARAELLPIDRVTATVAYHLPTAHRTGQPAELTAEAAVKRDELMRTVTVTLHNILLAEVKMTGAQLSIADLNGVIEKRLMVDGKTATIPIFTLPAQGEQSLEIDPDKFAFRLIPGCPYIARIDWEFACNGNSWTYAQVFPYLTPETTPVFASDWVKSGDISIRLLLRQTEKKGLQALAEFRNEVMKPVEISLSPYVDNQVIVKNGHGAILGERFKDIDAPDIRVLLTAGGSATVVLSQGGQLGYLALIPKSYDLAPGAYRLSATLLAKNRDTAYRWTLPMLDFLVPQPDVIPVIQPLKDLRVR